MALFIKRFGKLFKKNKRIKFDPGRNKKDTSTSNQNIICYGYGKKGHIKSDCPGHDKKKDFKGKNDHKPRRTYIAWDDNEVSSSSISENEGCAKFTLMASHHSDDEKEEISRNYDSCDDDDSDINELLDECKSLYKKVSKQKE